LKVKSYPGTIQISHFGVRLKHTSKHFFVSGICIKAYEQLGLDFGNHSSKKEMELEAQLVWLSADDGAFGKW